MSAPSPTVRPPIEDLLVTVGNQPLAALAAIVSLRPKRYHPIASDDTKRFLPGIDVAVRELGVPTIQAPAQLVQEHSPHQIAGLAASLRAEDWFGAAHFAYAGGTKPMSWAFATQWWNPGAEGRAWYVADDLGLVTAMDGTTLHIDQSKDLAFETLIGLHGWKTSSRAPAVAVTRGQIDRLKGPDWTGLVREVHVRGATSDGPSQQQIHASIVRGWRLTLVRFAEDGEQAPKLAWSSAELARELGGNAASSIVVLQPRKPKKVKPTKVIGPGPSATPRPSTAAVGSRQPAATVGDVIQREILGAAALRRAHRVVRGRDMVDAVKSATARPPAATPLRPGTPLRAAASSSVAPVSSGLVVTLGLNPLAVVAAAYAHFCRNDQQRFDRIVVLHATPSDDPEETTFDTSMIEGLEDAGDDADNDADGNGTDGTASDTNAADATEETDGSAVPKASPDTVESSLALIFDRSHATLRSVLCRWANEVRFELCGPHDSPQLLLRHMSGISGAFRGSWLDATGGTKALTLAATQAWCAANPDAGRRAVDVTYTRTAASTVTLSFLSTGTTASADVPPDLLDVTTMVELHGFHVVIGTPTDQNEADRIAKVQKVLPHGWAAQPNARCHARPGGPLVCEIDVFAVHGLASVSVETKSASKEVRMPDLEKIVSVSRLAGGSLAAAALVKDKAMSDLDVGRRFPAGNARSFAYNGLQQFTAWLEDRVR